MATVLNKPQEAAAPKPGTQLEVFRAQLLTQDRLEELRLALPEHVKIERFKRNLDNALMQNPQLLTCPPALVWREVAKVAALGLVLDPQLGEAWIIIGWNARANRNEPQLRIGYRGLIKLARQSGEIGGVYAHEMCANDEVVMDLGTDKKLEHRPNLKADRGEEFAYYAVVKFADGSSDFEPMSIPEINKIRDRSDAWKAFKAGKIKTTPWADSYGEMAKKTVMRRLLKRVPASPDLADAWRIEDEAEGYDQAEPATRAAPRSAKQALDEFSGGITIDQAPSREEGDAKHPVDALDEVLRDAAEASGAEVDQDAVEAARGIADAPVEEAEGDALPEMPMQMLGAADGGKWLDAWKWLNAEVLKLRESSQRIGLLKKYRPVLDKVAAHNTAYEKAVAALFAREGIPYARQPVAG